MSLEKKSVGGLISRILKEFKVKHIEEPVDYTVVNSKKIIMQRCADCQKAGGMPPTILSLDFVDKGDVYKTIKEINQERFPDKIK